MDRLDHRRLRFRRFLQGPWPAPLRGRLIAPTTTAGRGAGGGGHQIFWRTHLDGRDDAIGRPVLLGGTSFTVIGVAPPRFHGMQTLDPG